MLFNSVPFLVFFPIVVTLYFVLPLRSRWILLLAASYYFYMQWEPAYALLIMASTLIDYSATVAMSKRETKEGRRPFLYLSLISNLGILFFFKYYNFANANLTAIVGRPILPFSSVLLPVGISFYTFQSLSYAIDVYRGRMVAEKNLGALALSVIYFPQLVAGPIERVKHLLPQLTLDHRFDEGRVKRGLQLMAWGMFKKVCVADRITAYTKAAFGDPEAHSGSYLALAAILFAIQVYADFSGYSDIAIGSAEVMGVRLLENFRRPFFARNIEELWKRWHMSLTGWMKDYVYQPLAYASRRAPVWRKQVDVLAVFLVTGIWHGASWKFVAWGLLNGLFVVGHVVTAKPRQRAVAYLRLDAVPRLHAAVSIAFTFSLFASSAIFFAARDFTSAISIFGRIAASFDLGGLRGSLLAEGPTNLALAAAGVAILLSVDALEARVSNLWDLIGVQPTWKRWILYLGVVSWILLFGVFERQEFVYFQF